MKSAQTRNLYGRLHFPENQLPLWIFRRSYRKKNDRWHCHVDFTELVVVLSGSVRHETENGERLLLCPGSVLLMKPGSVHRYAAINNLVHYNVLFRREIMQFQGDDFDFLPGFRMLFEPEGSVSPQMYLDEKLLSQLVQMLEHTRTELLEQAPGWQTVAQAEFMQIAVFLSRYILPMRHEASLNAFKISRVIQWIKQNCEKDLTLQSMAAYAKMSVSSFRHHFHEITGEAPVSYMIRLRLCKALWLLTTSATVAEIAEECGFASGNYLARQFKKYLNMSPREFQQKSARNEISLREACHRLESRPF